MRVGKYIFALCLTWAALVPQVVYASSNCSASLSNINFGTVDPFGGNVDVAATLTFTCSKGLLDLSSEVRICVDIGEGTAGDGTISPRRMGNGSGGYLNFNLYTDSARSIIWGHPSYAYPTYTTVRSYDLLGLFTIIDTIQIYGRVFGGQSSAVPGSYSNAFSGINARIRWADGSSPTNCNEGTANFSFSALATVQPQCSISASNMDFGSHSSLGAAADAASSIAVTCTNGAAYEVGLNNGMNDLLGLRRMKSGSNYIQYDLYRDSSRLLRWGNTLGLNTQTGTGSGSQQNLTVYGRVPLQTLPSPGTYSDTITVTITF